MQIDIVETLGRTVEAGYALVRGESLCDERLLLYDLELLLWFFKFGPGREFSQAQATRPVDAT